jgi:hypothetical protein
MANAKYDNLMVLMSTGKLNWAGDAIVALLMTGATYNAAHTTVTQAGGTRMSMVPVPQRSVDPSGSLLGGAVSFSNMPKDTNFQMIIAKDTGPGTTPTPLAFYDVDGDVHALRLDNNGTLIVRPEQLLPAEDTGQGVWVTT